MTQQKIYKEVSSYLKKGTKFLDVRHIVTLAWMIAAVIGSKSVNQAEWGSYVQSRAQKEDSNQKRWRRFLNNGRVGTGSVECESCILCPVELREHIGVKIIAPTRSPPPRCRVLQQAQS